MLLIASYQTELFKDDVVAVKEWFNEIYCQADGIAFRGHDVFKANYLVFMFVGLRAIEMWGVHCRGRYLCLNMQIIPHYRK